MKPENNNYQRPERREAKRCRGTIAEYSLDNENSLMQPAFVKNISFKGICLVINRRIEVDTIIFLNIYLLGDKQPVSTKARVVWQDFTSTFGMDKIKHYSLGVKFVDLSQDKREKLIKALHAT